MLQNIAATLHERMPLVGKGGGSTSSIPSKKWVGWILIVSLLAILGGGGYYAYTTLNGNNNSSTSIQTFVPIIHPASSSSSSSSTAPVLKSSSSSSSSRLVSSSTVLAGSSSSTSSSAVKSSSSSSSSSSTATSSDFFITGQQGSKLIPSDRTGNAGVAVTALSSGGNTLAVTGWYDNSLKGATWVFNRFSNGTWIQDGSKIVVGVTQQTSIALSADGTTMAIGSITANSSLGGVWIYVQSSVGVWSFQAGPLLGTGYTGSTPQQGNGLALSADGNTLAVGGTGNNAGVGAVWIWTRSNSLWSQQAGPLVGTGYAANSEQGRVVSLSSDGNTLAVGGRQDSPSGPMHGAVWIFIRTSGTSWSQQGSKIVSSDQVDGSIGAKFGSAIHLSGNGDTLAVGAPFDNNNIGATWVFTRNNTIWTQQGNKIIANPYIGTPNQGGGVALSADGNVLIVGGYSDNSNIGALWTFALLNGQATQVGSKITATDMIGAGELGINGISVSASGNTVVAASYKDNSNVGAAFVFG